ncbi:CHRD domain-containing protein [Spirosoma sp. KUDC1026]|uniref:CHRD domain-containing protein n=1 Tax=Spirosoma sp. KUDC1026 TaxID=2745947 RepID=UPI00159BBFB5|nr:CHRD domain-containing protein [Spirosoma sp. KUDC1026]QKZ13389.1 CHRD domain-containing protein [Spirosoma sp. KUDC1026]
MIKKNVFLSALVLVLFGLTLTSCWDEENPTTVPSTTMFTATLNGANEKPTSTTSPATGMFMGSLNETTRVLSYTVTYSGFPASTTVIGAHLHRVIPNDAAGVNGVNPTPEIPFTTLTSPITGTTPALSAARVDSMKRGFYYANIHTNNYPSGAIRGNVTVR